MQLSTATKKWFGFEPTTNPFSDTPDGAEALFRWPAFDDVVERIVEAVLGHRFLIVAGNYGSSKSTAWQLAREQLEGSPRANVLIAEPAGLDPRTYDDNTVYRAVVHCIGDGQKLRQSRADRATQCQEILARHYDRSGPERKCRSAFVVNDAHCCKRDFLLMCKRLWDQLHGFARMTAVVLIGQAPLYAAVEREGEISVRREVVILPGLGQHIPDYVRFECTRCGVEADSIFRPEAYEALRTLRSDKRFDTNDHPLRVSNVVARALRTAQSIRSKTVDADAVGHAIRSPDDDAGETRGRRQRLAIAAE